MASPVYFVTRIFKISDSSSLFSYPFNISGSPKFCLKMKKLRFMFFSFFLLGSKEKRDLIASMAGWASGSQIPPTTVHVCLCSFCSVNEFSKYLYDTWCAFLLTVQIPSLWKVFLRVYLSKYTSLKKRYASPIGFSGLCSPGRVTLKKIQQERMCCLCCDSETISIKDFFLVLCFITIYFLKCGHGYVWLSEPSPLLSRPCVRASLPHLDPKKLFWDVFFSMRPYTQPAPFMI